MRCGVGMEKGAAQKRHMAPKRRDASAPKRHNDISTEGADHIDAERGTAPLRGEQRRAGRDQ